MSHGGKIVQSSFFRNFKKLFSRLFERAKLIDQIQRRQS